MANIRYFSYFCIQNATSPTRSLTKREKNHKAYKTRD